jgi:hypothetical protein
VNKRAKELPKPKERRPDRLFYATLKDSETQRVVARKVLCELYLPDSYRAKPELIFHPRQLQLSAFEFVPAVSLDGVSRNSRFEIKADEVWHEGATSGSQDGISFLHPSTGRASTLEITYLRGRRKSKYVKGGVFWLTECQLFNTASTITRSYTGRVQVKQIVKPKFTLNGSVKVAFRKHYVRDRDQRNKELVQLVGELKPTSQLAVNSLENAVADLDDMLLLASLAARHRCVCTGWSFHDDNGNITSHYRRDLVLPSEERRNLDDCLIRIQDFMGYLRKTYKYLKSTPHPELIKNAIYALTYEGGTIDNHFLKLFAGLESVLLHVERINGSQHRHLSDKLRFFQQSYHVDLADLWPLLDKTGGTSLAQIRNRLIHGEYLSEKSLQALMFADQNLRWTLERMLLAVLGWPVSKSNVSKFLVNFTAYRWASMRSKI